MSYATQKADCDPNCALWRPYDGQNGQCGLLTLNDRIADGFEALADSLREIKGRL
jgi:hypothetical protein